MYTTRMDSNTHINIHCHHLTHQSAHFEWKKIKQGKQVNKPLHFDQQVNWFQFIVKSQISSSDWAMNDENQIRIAFVLYSRNGINHI